MDVIWLILALAAVTYFTRSVGHLIVAQFGTLHPRVLAALDAVPAAVITTIVIPPVINGGMAEKVAFIVTILVGFRLSIIPTLLIGLAVLSLLRLLLA